MPKKRRHQPRQALSTRPAKPVTSLEAGAEGNAEAAGDTAEKKPAKAKRKKKTDDELLTPVCSD